MFQLPVRPLLIRKDKRTLSKTAMLQPAAIFRSVRRVRFAIFYFVADNLAWIVRPRWAFRMIGMDGAATGISKFLTKATCSTPQEEGKQL